MLAVSARRRLRRLWPSRLPIGIVFLLLDGWIAAVIAQLDTESVVENARQGCGIDALIMTQVFNGPEQTLIVLQSMRLTRSLAKRPGITPAFICFEMGMTQKRLMDVSVVVKRNQIRGSACRRRISAHGANA